MLLIRVRSETLEVYRATTHLRQVEGQRKPDLSDTPRGAVTRAWRSLVLDADSRVVRHGYTFCPDAD
jgi:hypothetical protein